MDYMEALAEDVDEDFIYQDYLAPFYSSELKNLRSM